MQGCFFWQAAILALLDLMNPKLCEVVQRDADVLWWSRDPTLETSEDGQQESQLHLIECPIINRGFWGPLSQHINSLGLQAENNPTFWITGTLGSGEQTDSESWAMVTWAWRSLYACTTKTHLEGVKLNLKVALMLTFRYAISRTIAHGRRWKLWFTRQEDHHKASRPSRGNIVHTN